MVKKHAKFSANKFWLASLSMQILVSLRVLSLLSKRLELGLSVVLTLFDSNKITNQIIDEICCLGI